MCYGYGVNDYALSVGYGYPGCNNMGPMGAGYTSTPSLNPQGGAQSEGDASAYKKSAHNGDTGIKIGATILASVAIAGLMIKGARGKNIKKAAEAAEKEAKDVAKEIKPGAEAVKTKVSEAKIETETLLGEDGKIAADTKADGGYYNSENKLVKINGTLDNGSRYSSKYDPNTNLETECSYYNKDGDLTSIDKYIYDDKGEFLSKVVTDVEGNVSEVPYARDVCDWDYSKRTKIK